MKMKLPLKALLISLLVAAMPAMADSDEWIDTNGNGEWDPETDIVVLPPYEVNGNDQGPFFDWDDQSWANLDDLWQIVGEANQDLFDETLQEFVESSDDYFDSLDGLIYCNGTTALEQPPANGWAAQGITGWVVSDGGAGML